MKPDRHIVYSTVHGDITNIKTVGLVVEDKFLYILNEFKKTHAESFIRPVPESLLDFQERAESIAYSIIGVLNMTTRDFTENYCYIEVITPQEMYLVEFAMDKYLIGSSQLSEISRPKLVSRESIDLEQIEVLKLLDKLKRD